MENRIEQQRIAWVDIAKGIGIWLVVFLHLPQIGSLTYFNFFLGGQTWYMLLFFILSGMFFRNGKLIYRLRRLLIPYVCFYIICYLFFEIKQLVKNESIDFDSLSPLLAEL